MTVDVQRQSAWDNDHDRLDEMRRRTHVAIAALIDADPTLLGVPVANIRRWARDMGHMRPVDAEWLKLLTESTWTEVRAVLTGRDAEAVRLRQSSPFAGMLPQHERLRIHGTVPT